MEKDIFTLLPEKELKQMYEDAQKDGIENVAELVLSELRRRKIGREVIDSIEWHTDYHREQNIIRGED